MTALLDTSILIDILHGRPEAISLLQALTEVPASSEICRVELLQGLRPGEYADADALVSEIDWIPVVEPVSVRAGELGRQWRPSHSGIGVADLIIAASAELTGSTLVTLNVKHFPMIAGLRAAY